MITFDALACGNDLLSSIHARLSEHDIDNQAIQPTAHHTIHDL
jgi:hypothetical protein